MLRWEEGIPKPGKVMNACLNILLDEIQQAVVWSRPSILFAIHQSKNDQSRAIAAMEHKLKNLSMEVVFVDMEGGSGNILDSIIHDSNSRNPVFIVHDLGNQPQTYDGLNMNRELIVEHRIKLIFWLTVDEMIFLSRRAPDFWAFRHRVIEFPTGPSSRKNNLPSGALLWHRDNSIFTLDMIQKKIAFQEELLQNILSQNEITVSHAQVVGDLVYYQWLAGENQKITALLSKEINKIKSVGLPDLYSMLLNAQAINSFDWDDPRSALVLIEQALELTPKWSLLWSNHGIICRSAGQAKRSLSSLKKAITLNPTSAESWGVMGYMYMSLGKYASAIPNFEEALTFHPESVNLYPAMAVCYSRAGNIEKLDEIINKITDVVKNNGYLLVCRDGLLGNVSSALNHLEELVISKKIPSVFLRRDPNLRFIFGATVLQELV